ncbi:unnamed protein product, partial [Amoebophrya sp. A120]
PASSLIAESSTQAAGSVYNQFLFDLYVPISLSSSVLSAEKLAFLKSSNAAEFVRQKLNSGFESDNYTSGRVKQLVIKTGGSSVQQDFISTHFKLTPAPNPEVFKAVAAFQSVFASVFSSLKDGIQFPRSEMVVVAPEKNLAVDKFSIVMPSKSLLSYSDAELISALQQTDNLANSVTPRLEGVGISLSAAYPPPSGTLKLTDTAILPTSSKDVATLNKNSGLNSNGVLELTAGISVLQIDFRVLLANSESSSPEMKTARQKLGFSDKSKVGGLLEELKTWFRAAIKECLDSGSTAEVATVVSSSKVKSGKVLTGSKTIQSNKLTLSVRLYTGKESNAEDAAKSVLQLSQMLNKGTSKSTCVLDKVNTNLQTFTTLSSSDASAEILTDFPIALPVIQGRGLISAGAGSAVVTAVKKSGTGENPVSPLAKALSDALAAADAGNVPAEMITVDVLAKATQTSTKAQFSFAIPGAFGP